MISCSTLMYRQCGPVGHARVRVIPTHAWGAWHVPTTMATAFAGFPTSNGDATKRRTRPLGVST